MRIDYDKLAKDRPAEGVPDDGAHIARLDRAVVREVGGIPKMITEWSADGCYWTAWNTLVDKGLKFAQEIIDGLGIDRAELAEQARSGNDQALEDALAYVEGNTYEVTTKATKARGGDKWYVDVYDVTKVQGVQRTLGDDVPIDASDLTPPGSERAPEGSLAGFDDDEIPF